MGKKEIKRKSVNINQEETFKQYLFVRLVWKNKLSSLLPFTSKQHYTQLNLLLFWFWSLVHFGTLELRNKWLRKRYLFIYFFLCKLKADSFQLSDMARSAGSINHTHIWFLDQADSDTVQLHFSFFAHKSFIHNLLRNVFLQTSLDQPSTLNPEWTAELQT